MWPFNRKESEPLTLPKPQAEELVSMMEVLAKGGLTNAIESSIQKTIDSSNYYQQFENADDQGNYFGTEFNIKATAGRIKQSYTREPWMFATATLIARTLSTVPFVVKNAKTLEVDPNHPLNAKLKMANRNTDVNSLNWNGYLDLVLGGNFFRVFNETYTECVQIPVELVSLKLAPDKKSIEYIMLYDNEKAGYSTMIPYKQVIHHKYPNPFYPFYGMSIYTAASRPILLDRYKNEFEMAFYLRGATNAGVIETTEDINKSRMERLMRTFEQIYTGRRNWWRTIFLPKGAKWVQSGLTMSEMQHLEGLRENRLSLLAVLGVPPSQVGIVQDVNRATSEVQERNFWLNTIKPMAEFISAGWNNSYLVKTLYMGQVIVEPDFSEVQALQGSLQTKGEQAKSVESYLLIDEIREDILGYAPLPDGKGQKFVAEIGGGQQQMFGALAQAESANPIEQVIEETEAQVSAALSMKAQAVASQERIERRLTDDYSKGYGDYIDELVTVAEKALRDGRDVQTALVSAEEKLARQYMKGCEESLLKALERGFSFAASQTKAVQMVGKISEKRLRFSEVDQQAIDKLREEQRSGKRTTLLERSIERFVGFNKTRSKEILDVIADGMEDGKTADQIAAVLRGNYGEAYKNQAFTVARTELLTAISEGIKWNHDVLGEVFSEVKKQWFHVGDEGSNPDARDWHAEFETLGAVPSDYKWGGVLEYPRDPSAGPNETINCRCSMVSVIPDDADSNADVILDR